MGSMHLKIDDANKLLGLVADGIGSGEESKGVANEVDVSKHQ